MKWIINILLLALIAYLAYTLYLNIREPITFQNIKNERESAVVAKLKDIRKAQEVYRAVTGNFAKNFDTLFYVLRNDSIMIENIEGDPDDPENTNFIRTIIYKSALDSITNLGVELEGLEIVPYTDNEVFSIDADTMTYQQTLVSVVEVGTRYKTFMGQYGSLAYAKYDNSYDPNNFLKFGNMNAPNLTGNWE